jgi:hypothetical protein
LAQHLEEEKADSCEASDEQESSLAGSS